MTNPFRGKDAPADPFIPTGEAWTEERSGTRHPSRFEPTQSTIKPSQANPIDAAQVQRVNALNVNTGDIISWDTKLFDTQGLWNGTTTITVPKNGKVTGPWAFHTKITWPGTGAGSFRQVDILRNGASIATTSGPVATTAQDVSVVVYSPNRGDTFTVKVTDDSGGALALVTGATRMFFEYHHPW